jgi:Spy/CpxP family protein refolding chaperone
MAKFNMTTMLAALLAGSLAATAGGLAYAKTDGARFDPARFQEHTTKRVDRALKGTDATAEQKKKIVEILNSTFTDLKPLRDKRIENRKAMAEAMQATSIDRLKIEQIRVEQMKVSDESSRRFTQALEDAGDVLSVQQRQAFFKNWSDRQGGRHGRRPG